MTALIHVLNSPLCARDAHHEEVESGQTLHDFFSSRSQHYRAGDDQPIIVLVDNKEIEPAQWMEFVIPQFADIVVCPRPAGLSAAAIYAIIEVVILIAAVYYASTIQPPNLNERETPQQSPSYSLNVQGNQARLGEPIPARYGRFRIYPDFASAPYREYIGQDEYVYQLFSMGQGSYAYSELRISDTNIENYNDVEWAFYEPGQNVTLFPSGVHTSSEVGDNGITLFAPDDDDYLGISGPYVANINGTVAVRLAVDVMFPRGLNYANDDGGLDSRSVTTLFEYRAINDAGLPIGTGVWSTLANPVHSGSTIDVLRYTLSAEVAPGRYEVRGQRITGGVDDYRQNDEARWVGLRAYLQGTQTFSHSTWAVKCRATNQLTAQSERKFNCVATRKLPIWDGAAWTPATATRNPAWAFCDALRAEYGGNYAESHLELDLIKAVADQWDERGDCFDGQYDTKGTLWSALQQICAAGRAFPYQYGEQFSIIRDDGDPAGVYMFNTRNIKRDSMTVTYQTMDQWADDSVEIEYIDPVSWKPDTIVCEIPGVPAQRPRNVKLFGVTDKTQAYREGMFLAAKMAYRNILGEFSTELDGRVPQYLDRLLVSHEVYQWGNGGEVTAVAGDVLTLTQPVTFGATNNYIWLRGDRGNAVGPLAIAAVVGHANQVRLLDAPGIVIRTGGGRERTYFAIAADSVTPRKMLLDQVEAGDGLEVKVRVVLDDPRVHQFDALINDGTMEPPASIPPAASNDLTITGVSIIHGGTVTAPKIRIAWSPVAAAKRYFIDISYDAGTTFSRVTVETNFVDLDVKPGTITIRIAAQDENKIGLFYEAITNAGAEFDAPPTPSGFALVGGAFAGSALKLQWNTDVAAVTWRVEYRIGSTVHYSQNNLSSPSTSLDASTARLNGLGREFDCFLYGINANGVRSLVAASLSVKNEQTAELDNVIVTGLPDQIMVQWDAPSETDNDGFRIYASQTEGFIPGPSNLIEPNAHTLIYGFPVASSDEWFVRVAAFDVWGNDELNFSAEYPATSAPIEATEIADDSISTPKLRANSVTAEKLFVTALSAITANMGTLTAGKLVTDIGSGVRVEIEAGHALPFWIGSGTKTIANSLIYLTSTGNLVARGLLIQDPAGNAVIGSGHALDHSLVEGLGNLALINGFTAANISTYIAAAAIPRALIGALNVGSADIQDLNVTAGKIATAAVGTLKIGANAVTVPVSAYTNGVSSTYDFSTYIAQQVTISNPDPYSSHPVDLKGACSISGAIQVGTFIRRSSGAVIGGIVASGGPGWFSAVVMCTDTIGAGETVTYQLFSQVYVTESDQYSVANRYMSAVLSAR